ncbi:tetratricopeptide repeat-containing hybrid sensor histidine kinase/response regulator [Aquimarina sp. 2304DJ70-9]|uniref:tetratricopeptide repeat-containing hybrid sensor histidine kinase/response regulator n=1 Tax=Aquimarina penaris TaxID=3231044 RepID=UPI0034632576
MRTVVLIFHVIFLGYISYGQNLAEKSINDSIEKFIIKSNDLLSDYKIKESLNYTIKAIDLAHQINNDVNISRGHYYMACNYEVIEDFKNTELHYKEALKYAKSAKDSIWIARSLNGLGNVYSDGYKDLQRGVDYYNQSLKIAKSIKTSEEEFGPILNLGWTYIDEKKYDLAYPYLVEAQQLAQDSIKIVALSHVKYLLGRYYAGKRDFEKANQLFNDVIKVIEGKEIFYLLKDTYEAKFEAFEGAGNTDSALYSIKKYLQYKDKLFDEEKLKQTEIAKLSFSVDEYQRELETAKKEKEYLAKIARNKVAISITSVSVVLLLVVVFFFYRGYRSKKKLNEVLKEKNEELFEAKIEAEKLTNVKSQFISTVSHELRTPLYGVVGITTLLMEDQEITSKHKKLLNSLKFSGDYLLDLINKVLKISKIESNKEKLTKTPTNLLQLSQNLLHSFDYQAKNKKNELVLEVQNELPEILLVDSLKLSEVLINLIGNSSKFTENGKIWLRIKIISIEKDEIMIRFEIEDNGLGIPEDKKEFVFEKFSQVGREFNKLEGTGLGLSIVKNLLEMMESEIHLDSKEGRGTKFYFDLKLEVIDEKNDDKPNLNGEDEINFYRKILVAEDNKINQIVTKNLLDLIGYDCTIVENGFNALQMVKKENFDLILMDLNMPYLNGLEATKRIREFDTATPIIALTAAELSEVQEECMAIGMNDIINKPLNKNDLRNIISKNLKR